jgi:hypothetical protein
MLKDKRVAHISAVRHAVVGHAVVGMTRHAVVRMTWWQYAQCTMTCIHDCSRSDQVSTKA